VRCIKLPPVLQRQLSRRENNKNLPGTWTVFEAGTCCIDQWQRAWPPPAAATKATTMYDDTTVVYDVNAGRDNKLLICLPSSGTNSHYTVAAVVAAVSTAVRRIVMLRGKFLSRVSTLTREHFCPSVCLSVTFGYYMKRLKILLQSFHNTVAQSF